MAYLLAELNIARRRGNADDPIMKDLKDNLDRINNIAKSNVAVFKLPTHVIM